MQAIITFHAFDNSLIGAPEVREIASIDDIPRLVAELEARCADPDDELVTFALSFKRDAIDE